MNQPAPALPDHELSLFVRAISLGEPFELGDLTLVPLVSRAPELGLELLEDALQRGSTHVSEVSQEGVVGRVRVEHNGPFSLLMLQGEQLLGARQNRMLNESVILEPGKSQIVPVSCVERGRWREESTGFSASETTMPPSIRSSSHRMSTLGMLRHGTPDVDQGSVWTGVRSVMESTSVGSATEAYDDVVKARKADVDARIAAIPTVDGQIGVAAVHGSTLLSLEVLGGPDMFRKARRKLLRGLMTEPREPTLSPQARRIVADALESLARAAVQRVEEWPVAKLHAQLSCGSVSAVGYRGALAHALVTAG